MTEDELIAAAARTALDLLKEAEPRDDFACFCIAMLGAISAALSMRTAPGIAAMVLEALAGSLRKSTGAQAVN
jgi:hypothetical protein